MRLPPHLTDFPSKHFHPYLPSHQNSNGFRKNPINTCNVSPSLLCYLSVVPMDLLRRRLCIGSLVGNRNCTIKVVPG